jgi:putative serine protease PepD
MPNVQELERTAAAPPPEESAPEGAPTRPPLRQASAAGRRRRRGRPPWQEPWLRPGQALVTVVVAALLGAVEGLAVARVTGWGQQTVVTRFVPQNTAVGSQATDVGAILSAVLPSVVSITATSTQSSPSSAAPSEGAETVDEGTGVILTSDGEVLTNNHVINGATAITVTSTARPWPTRPP